MRSRFFPFMEPMSIQLGMGFRRQTRTSSGSCDTSFPGYRPPRRQPLPHNPVLSHADNCETYNPVKEQKVQESDGGVLHAEYQPGQTQSSLLQTADRMLYSAKDTGRNRVIVNDNTDA